jgi:dienelactone hydrolase
MCVENTYENSGSLEETEGIEYYGNGISIEKAILIIPDVWGYNSGRIRSIADLLAAEGYYVAIPKLLSPPLEGGTEGRTLYLYVVY